LKKVHRLVAHALAGMPVRALLSMDLPMKPCLLRARPAALSLALAAAFAAIFFVTGSAQAQSSLPEVKVVATRFAEDASSLAFGVSSISAEEIQASGATTVNEAITRLLGVPGRLDISGGNNYSLDLRGFGSTADSNQVVVVDGLRLNEADLSGTGLSSIPIESVYKIEVLRGSGAVLYGEGATGGVIVITTKAGVGLQRKNSANLVGAAGSYGLRDVRGSFAVAAGGFSLDVSADNRRTNGHRENFASKSNALSATAQWSNEWLRVGARAGRASLESGLPGALTAAQYAENPYQANSTREFGNAKKQNSGVFAEANLGAWQLAFDANQRKKQYESELFGSPYAYDIGASNYGVRVRHEAKVGSFGNVLTAGYDKASWDRTITQSSFTPPGTLATAKTSAIYLKDELVIPASGTRLNVGIRTEKIERVEAASASDLNDRQKAFELGISQKLSGNAGVYARIGKSFRIANVDEFSFTTPGVPLKAQTSRDMEVGVRYKTPQTQLDARLYRSNLKNEIGYDPSALGPFGPFGANVNFDPTRRQGIEVEARQALSSTMDLRVNAAWRQARFVEGVYAGSNVALVPAKTLAVRADWRFAPGQSLNAGVNWVSSQSADFANVCQIPSYATIDLRYAIEWRNAEFAIGAANLADRKFYTQAFGCDSGVTTAIYPEAGRVVTASVRFKF
jgi:iron complex outermembrane recepter protein